MKQTYEKSVLRITLFTEREVIATSEEDRHNAYTDLSTLNNKQGVRYLDTIQ